MELENKMIKRRMLEALDYIDDDIISSTVKKIKPDECRTADPVITWRTPLKHWKRYLALVACLLLLSAASPLVNFVTVVIRNFNPGAGSESTEAISSEFTETESPFTTESIETEQPPITTEAVYTEPVYQYVVTREEFDEMTAAWKIFLNNDKAYIVKEYEYFTYYNPCRLSACIYMKRDGLVVFCIHNHAQLYNEMTVAGYLFKIPHMEQIWVYNDQTFISLTKAYNSGLLSENDIKELSEIHHEHMYSDNIFG